MKHCSKKIQKTNSYRRNTNEPAFAIRRNVIPFFEMITIIPTVCFFLMSSMAESMVICAKPLIH
ncbi:MAG: hypothetical protein KTV77_01780 [Wolbachia endosymbiont of Fragariocoptes setiger]|nr:hypothetical protein [Wolbachia endosymbiont of Fragariocoptes setiger]